MFLFYLGGILCTYFMLRYNIISTLWLYRTCPMKWWWSSSVMLVMRICVGCAWRALDFVRLCDLVNCGGCDSAATSLVAFSGISSRGTVLWPCLSECIQFLLLLKVIHSVRVCESTQTCLPFPETRYTWGSPADVLYLCRLPVLPVCPVSFVLTVEFRWQYLSYLP